MRTLRSVFLLCLVALLAGSLHGGSFAQAAKVTGAGASAPAKTGQVLDLNTASAADLKSLPGIGDAYSKRIVDGRPYTAKNQLVTKGILPQATYDKIKDNIVARKTAK